MWIPKCPGWAHSCMPCNVTQGKDIPLINLPLDCPSVKWVNNSTSLWALFLKGFGGRDGVPTQAIPSPCPTQDICQCVEILWTVTAHNLGSADAIGIRCVQSRRTARYPEMASTAPAAKVTCSPCASVGGEGPALGVVTALGEVSELGEVTALGEITALGEVTVLGEVSELGAVTALGEDPALGDMSMQTGAL